MTTPVVLGSNRELWFANLSDTTPQWSFLEDASGTTKRSGALARTQRLGDPINLGPNSSWHQLSWEGGELQDVWKDVAMYQSGDIDVLTQSGKARMWPGLLSWWKNERKYLARGLSMVAGSQLDAGMEWNKTPLYFGERDLFFGEARAAEYNLYRLHPGYARGTPQTVQHLHNNSEPYRILFSANDDDNISGGLIGVCTATHMYFLQENTNLGTIQEDTGAPATTAAGYEYQWDSMVGFDENIYYLHGNRLFKRVGHPPYGVVGTHTLIKKIQAAVRCTGLTVWNNRLYLGAYFPNGDSSIYISDGATTTKAFQFPVSFIINKLKAVAGALYIEGMATSDVHSESTLGNMVHQVWRYDGRSLKKLWQEGTPSDGELHWPSGLTEWNGYVVWGRQGTPGNGGRANIMFYDPVNDSIVRGPGLDKVSSNIGDGHNGLGLWITGLCPWHNTVMVNFQDDTIYSAHFIESPSMLASMRPENYPKNDLRWPMTGDVVQFNPTTLKTSKTLVSSEYHGPDDVAAEQKTWLSFRCRAKLTGSGAHITVSAIDPSTGTTTVLGTISDNGTHNWQDVKLAHKDGSGNYLKSKKVQYKLELYNDSANYDDTSMAWIDDADIQYVVTPAKVRQWQLRIPVTDAQLTLHSSNAANSLTTADLLAQKLEDLYFTGAPVRFWEPSAAGTIPPDTSTSVEVRILDFQRSQARLVSDESGTTGTVALTLIENVTT